MDRDNIECALAVRARLDIVLTIDLSPTTTFAVTPDVAVTNQST